MTRKQALDYIRIAGYHGDSREFTRLYIENRVSMKAARDAFKIGADQRRAGWPCGCHECKKAKAQENG